MITSFRCFPWGTYSAWSTIFFTDFLRSFQLRNNIFANNDVVIAILQTQVIIDKQLQVLLVEGIQYAIRFKEAFEGIQ